MIQETRGGVICDVEVEATIVVIVSPDHAQAVILLGINPQLHADFRESSILIVAVQEIALAGKATRATVNRQPAIRTEGGLPKAGG